MSKRSKRNRKEARELLKSQNNPQDRSSKPQPNPKQRKTEPEVIDRKKFYQQPAILGIFGTVGLAIAAFIQAYSHIWAIIVLYFSLLIYLQLLRVEIFKHTNSKKFLHSVGLIACILISGLCFVLFVLEVKYIRKNSPFTFLFPNPDEPTKSLKLTNEWFLAKKWGVLQKSMGAVLIPVQIGQTNFVLTLRVRSSNFAAKPEFFITLPVAWGIEPGDGWIPSIDEDIQSYTMGIPQSD